MPASQQASLLRSKLRSVYRKQQTDCSAYYYFHLMAAFYTSMFQNFHLYSFLMSKQRNKQITNVPQTFHKRSPNVPTSCRNDTKTSEFVPHRKRSEQILDQIETICSQQDKFGNDTKTFWFSFQNNIGIFVLSFLTILHLSIDGPEC